MFKSYLKVAWRNMVNNKVYTTINMLGLSAGMAVTIVIALWVYREYSYNRFLPAHQQAYQVYQNHLIEGSVRTENGNSLPLADALRKEIPEIKYVAETDWNDRHGLMVGDTKLLQRGLRVGQDFLHILQYPLVNGNAAQVLKDPYSIVLTEATATSLFGHADPIGKVVRYENKYDLKVTGVLKDPPATSTFRFTYLIPFAFRELTTDWVRYARTQWDDNSFQLFIALQPNATQQQVQHKIEHFIQTKRGHKKAATLLLHAAKDWHLYTRFENGKVAGGLIEYVRLFAIIGVLVLIIACINFTNLATARSQKRAREVGVRKAMGSQRKHLVFQFLAEAACMTLLALLLALVLVQCALPFFNELTAGSITVPYTSPVFWGLMTGFLLVTSILAGARSAFYLSSFKPVTVLKGKWMPSQAAGWSRKSLVVLQFSCSIFLIIGTIVVYRQIQHVKDRPMGYEPGGLMMTDMNRGLNVRYDALRNSLMASGLVENVTRAMSPVIDFYSRTFVNQWPGKSAGSDLVHVGSVGVSESYFKTLGMRIVAGRDFTSDWKSDSATVILNEAAVQKMQLKEPIGQTIEWNGKDKARIIGVVKNALIESPFTAVTPAVFTHEQHGVCLMYRVKPGVNMQTAIAGIEKIFKKYNQSVPYSYQFVSEEYADKFKLEVLTGKLAAIFAVLAIFISCMGLFGLAAYIAEQRTKEIGVRKVLGASVSQLWLMLSKEFITLVGISCLIATPVGAYFLHNWLQQYNYRVELGPLLFVTASVLALVITIITISFQTIKAALANPVNSLRTE